MGGLTVTSRLAPNNGAQSDSTSSVSWERGQTGASTPDRMFYLHMLFLVIFTWYLERAWPNTRSCYRGATSLHSCRRGLFHSQGLDISYIINTIKNRLVFKAYDEAVFPRGWTPCAASWASPWTWNTWESDILRRGCFITKDGDKEGYFLSMAKPACVILRQDWNWCEIIFLSTF